MFLEITGFLHDDSEDDSIKFELDVHPKFEQTIMDVLGWESLAAQAVGEHLLTTLQVQKIGTAIKEQLPTDLEMYIGTRSGPSIHD